MRHIATALSVAGLLAITQPTAAHACGACVSPPPPPQGAPKFPVLQNAERVLFYTDAKQNTVAWVEVRYQGLAENFGWVLPLPKVPDVSVGSALVFDRLDTVMARRFEVKSVPRENCHDAMDGCDPEGTFDNRWQGSFADAAAEEDGSGSSGGSDTTSGSSHSPDAVKILAEGSTGPYDYVVISGSDAGKLNTWLNDKKFVTPTAATPIIDSHIKKGDVFLAIKLSNGQGVEAIKPVVLTMKDAEPCVPLRLTSIAAVADMSVIVTVAGPGRAVVKNHLDVVVNPLKINVLGGANNYGQAVSAAIDEAGGHAFVTEYSKPADTAATAVRAGLGTQGLTTASTLDDFAKWLYASGSVWLAPDAVELIDKEVKLADLIPYKATSAADALAWIWSCGSVFGGGGFMSQQCNYKGATLTLADAKGTPFPGAKVEKALKTGIIDPVYAVADGLAASKPVTRMVLRIDPQEMDRDPVFAFNTDDTLGIIDPVYVVQRNGICSDGWDIDPNAVRLNFPGVGSYVLDTTKLNGNINPNNALDPRFKDAPFALEINLQDESGPAIPIAAAQAELVDGKIAGALPGKPSLPAEFKLDAAKRWQPPIADPPVTYRGPWCPPVSYCMPRVGWRVITRVRCCHFPF